jgi:P pilus assembly chaperone PapD
MKPVTLFINLLLGCSLLLGASAQAAVSLDRTRVIFDGGANSMSININNDNKTLPYLAQAWLEDSKGTKINSPFTVLPPVQRLEPATASMLKIQALPAAASLLPQDRESLFYFNLREIPPRSSKPNTLQLALQTKVKFFYRPSALQVTPGSQAAHWQEKLQLKRQGKRYQLHNPTPYYITLVSAASQFDGEPVAEFAPMMLPPFGDGAVNVAATRLGSQPAFVYVDDYGGRRQLGFQCDASCQLARKE